MQKKTWMLGSGAAAAVLVVGGFATVSATGSGLVGSDERDDSPLTGETLSKASDAATKAAGGGKVTETEHSDDQGTAYNVEVTLDNGNQVDVDLDKNFNVVNTETDQDDDADESDDGDDKADADDERGSDDD